MKIRTIIGAASAAIAIATAAPVSAHDVGDKVTPNFAQAIPNIPGKSLIAVVVDYPPGGASAPHTHAKSSFIYAYVISGRIESKVNDGATRVYKAGDHPAPAIPSAAMRARPCRQSCSRSSSSIPTTRN
jgi:hypothetical protein